MPIIRLALLILLLASPLRAMELTYRLIVKTEEDRVHVTSTFSPVPAGMDTLRLVMQERYADGKPDQPRLDGRIRCIGKNTLIRQGPYRWAAPVEDGQALSLYFVVPLDRRDLSPEAGRNEYEQSCLAEDHGLLAAGTLFIVPEDVEIGAIHVGIRAPRGWPVICPWPEAPGGGYAPESREALMDDVIAIGNWDLRELGRLGLDAE